MTSPSMSSSSSNRQKPYSFPTDKLLTLPALADAREPLILVACGSFSPITYLHLRMFEMAADHIRENGHFELVGGYFSPVNQNYGKAGLAPAEHRVEMCRRAVAGSDWLMVDDWEATQDEYQRSANVLDHFARQLGSAGLAYSPRIMLLAGGDLIQSFSTPNLWAASDLRHILGNYGCVVIERTGTDVWGFLLSHDILYSHRRNVSVVKQLIYNDISSTKVRLFVRRRMSIRYLVPDAVAEYIDEHRLYCDDREPPVPIKVRRVVVTNPAASTDSEIALSHSESGDSDPAHFVLTNVAQVTADCEDHPVPPSSNSNPSSPSCSPSTSSSSPSSFAPPSGSCRRQG